MTMTMMMIIHQEVVHHQEMVHPTQYSQTRIVQHRAQLITTIVMELFGDPLHPLYSRATPAQMLRLLMVDRLLSHRARAASQ